MTANIPAILTGLSIGTVASGVGIAVVSYGEGGGAKFEKIFLDNSNQVISNYRNLPCVSSLFGTITWNAYPESETTKTKITGSSSSIALKQEDTQGCIYVWWQKEKYGEKWRGAWNLLWGMRDNTHGTIFVSTITADRGKVQADKYVYVLEKKEEKWKTIGKWSKDKESVTDNNKTNLVLTIGDSLPGITENNSADLDIQTNSVCPDIVTCSASSVSITSKELNWKYTKETTTGEQKKASDWSTKVNDAIKENTSLGINLQNVYTNINGHYQLEQTVHG